jgi:hypothetical protein
MCDSLVVLQNNVQVVNLLLTFDATNSCLRGIFHSPKKETEGIPHASPRAGDRAGHTLAAHPHIQLPPSRPRLRSIWKPMRHPRTRWRVCFLLIQAGRSGRTGAGLQWWRRPASWQRWRPALECTGWPVLAFCFMFFYG